MGVWKSIVRFAVISGAGWCVDFGLLWLLIGQGLQPVWANFLSACTAAALVYWSSCKIAFDIEGGGAKAATFGLLTYVVYTVLVVLCFSSLIQGISNLLFAVSVRYSWGLDVALAAVLAKVAVTPVNLAVNFLAARFISQRTR